MTTPAYRWVLSPTIEAVEDAIVAALLGDATIGAYTTTVVPFQGSLEAAMQQTAMRLPSVLVLYAGGDEEPAGMAAHATDMEWHVLVRAANLRGPRAAQVARSASDQVGAYQIIADVTRVLRGSDLDLADLEPIRVGEVSLLAAQGGPAGSSVAYQIVLRMRGMVLPNPESEDLTQAGLTVATPNSAGDFTAVATDEIEDLDA